MDHLRRLDQSSHMPRAVCRNGRVLAVVPAHLTHAYGPDAAPTPTLAAFIAEVARLNWASVEDVEILMVCHVHPQSSAVDCIDCEPLEI